MDYGFLKMDYGFLKMDYGLVKLTRDLAKKKFKVCIKKVLKFLVFITSNLLLAINPWSIIRGP